jgi:hypothetical protein
VTPERKLDERQQIRDHSDRQCRPGQPVREHGGREGQGCKDIILGAALLDGDIEQ